MWNLLCGRTLNSPTGRGRKGKSNQIAVQRNATRTGEEYSMLDATTEQRLTSKMRRTCHWKMVYIFISTAHSRHVEWHHQWYLLLTNNRNWLNNTDRYFNAIGPARKRLRESTVQAHRNPVLQNPSSRPKQPGVLITVAPPQHIPTHATPRMCTNSIQDRI